MKLISLIFALGCTLVCGQADERYIYATIVDADNCPPGKEFTMSEKQACINFQNYHGGLWGGVKRTPDWPKGCVRKGSQVYFNTHPSGKRSAGEKSGSLHSRAQAICYKDVREGFQAEEPKTCFEAWKGFGHVCGNNANEGSAFGSQNEQPPCSEKRTCTEKTCMKFCMEKSTANGRGCCELKSNVNGYECAWRSGGVLRYSPSDVKRKAMMCYVAPTKPTCQGNRSSWNAGHGDCSTYNSEDGDNRLFCSDKDNDGVTAEEACSECGKCADSSNAVDSETASLQSVNQALKEALKAALN